MKKRRIITAVIVVALAAALAVGWWVSTQAARPKVAVTAAASQTLDVVVTAKGTMAAVHAATVTAPTSGVLQKVAVVDGQQVTEGDLLASMDTQPLDQAVAQAEAQYAAARAMPTGSTRLNHARDAATHAAQLAVDAARTHRNDAELRAPATGTIQLASLSLAPGLPPLFTTASGVSVSAGMTLFTILGPDALRFEAAVDESDIAGVQVGQAATVTLDAYAGRPLTGTVEAIRPAATSTNTGGVAFTTTIKLDAGDAHLLTGMTGDADIATQSIPDAIVVPVQAVVADGTSRHVWKVDNGVAHKVAVEVGPSTDTLTQITSGLATGDLVATTNLTALKEGGAADVTG